MENLKQMLCLCAMIVAGSIVAVADGTGNPVFHKYVFSDNSIVTKLSDNGKWTLSDSGSDEVSGTTARIIYVDTDEAEPIQTEAEIKQQGQGSFSDVSNDGNIVAGSLKGQPAYFNRTTRQWTVLPIPSDCSGGSVSAMTPDAKYAVGTMSYSKSEYWATGVMWDLTTNTIVELTNVPTLDMTHEDQHQRYFTGISADGRYVIGMLSYSYIYPASLCSFIYDVQQQSYKMIGFTPDDTSDWTPLYAGLYFCDDPIISANGKYVACHAYMVKESAGSEFPSEYDAVGFYNVETDEFTVYDATADQGFQPFSVDDAGTVYAATPTSSPIREWSVRHNGYWYTLRQILSQQYGMSFDTKTQYDNTGSPYCVSTDGTRILCMVDPLGESYILDLPESAANVCDQIDLLSNYTLTPADGSTFARITTVELAFDRDIVVTSGAKASLKDDTSAEIKASMSFKVSDADSKTVAIRFRGTDLEAGRKYTVEIPAGTISLKDDSSKQNKAITITYNGRENAPVKVQSVYPENGSELAKIDNSGSLVVLTLDTEVETTDTATAVLVNTTAGETITTLNVYTEGNQVALYPSATQYLYKDQSYTITLAAGSLTDVTGNGGNEEYTINYLGTYVRELSHDDATLFSDDFSSISQSLNTWMRYEGDHLTPVSDMTAWEFDADNQPWNFSIRDESAADYCAASHSMYSPAGQSDDWMVIPQMEIPDEYCTLSFLGQSYRKSKADRLKVLVWENETNINYLNSDIIAQMKSDADVVFDEQLLPGSNEDNLAGDWTDYNVDLAKYAGKKIYIAFWNNNTDQSALFVDSVVVKRNLKYLLSLTNAESVVDQDEITIGGRLTVNSDFDTYDDVTLTLCDGDGTEIETITRTGLGLTKGEYFDFSFTKPLPLEKGETNEFTIKVKLDDYSDVVSSSVNNLVFRPTKRVVLEEFTGTTCVNCPLGILAIENLENIYGDQFIPISIHTYDGDQLGTGLSSYSSYLGLTAAPTGVVNRNGVISSPMWENPATFSYEFSNTLNLWADYVAEEMETPANLDMTATIKIDTENSTFTVPIEIKSALNAKNQMLNVFMVVVEDGVVSYQQNTFGAISDPNLGEWGKGGKYSESIVYNYTHNDVVRAVYGSSFGGSQGLVPQTLKAGETYNVELTDVVLPENIDELSKAKAVVMLIDANTEHVVNAVSVKFSTDPNAITGITGDTGCIIRPMDGSIEVATGGKVTVSLYTLAGTLVEMGNIDGTGLLSTHGYRGAMIVKVKGTSGVVTKKVMVK